MTFQTNIQEIQIERDSAVEHDISLIVPINSIRVNNSIPQRLLNIEDKNRSNLLPWKGQFSPQLIDVLLQNYAEPGFFILDPFLGSGTVLVESGRKNLKVHGTEINPAAFKLASIYTLINIKKEQIRKILKEFESLLIKYFFEKYDFFNINNIIDLPGELKHNLVSWLKIETNKEIKKLLEILIILLDFYKNDLTSERIYSTWEKIKKVVISLPFSNSSISLSHTDARNIPLKDNLIDLVITSPPYINVFNYHQQYRASIEAVGWKLLNVTKSEIGSNRKNRGNRFLTVIQYVYDIYDSFLELKRVCKPGARIIIIIGRESNVRKTRFFNSSIIASTGRIAGLEIEYRQERFFTNRFGKKIYEDIIHFRNTMSKFKCESHCIKQLAEQVLADAVLRAPTESIVDLHAAITSVENVKKSPIFRKYLVDHTQL